MVIFSQLCIMFMIGVLLAEFTGCTINNKLITIMQDNAASNLYL